MELSSVSAIKDTWKVFILGTIISCFMLILLLTQNSHNLKPPLLAQFPPLPDSSISPIISPLSPRTISSIVEPPFSSPNVNSSLVFPHNENPKVVNDVKRVMGPRKMCNMFDGRWVYKADAIASYCPLRCPFIEDKMSCLKNGRPDFEYEKWVWEPFDCDIPLMNGTDLVERFRNKKVVLVGDSLNRNMWESLACTLYSSIPYPSIKAEVRFESAHIKTYLKAKDEYNFTVEFYWSPYLVEHNTNHESGKKVLVLDKLSSNSESWMAADVLIFNSGMWWSQTGTRKRWELFEYNGKLTKDIPLHQAYHIAMRTWAKWVQQNVDPTKTKVFFRSISTEHKAPQYHQWCYDRSQPLVETYRSLYPMTLIRVIESVIRGMRKVKVTYLNVTKLSQSRIDAHPSLFRIKNWTHLATTYTHNLSSYTDCGHWCLPGVPDTWNRLLYASLVFDSHV
ncbi:unnamed protein product [Amaranthus hypochondriacus]